MRKECEEKRKTDLNCAGNLKADFLSGKGPQQKRGNAHKTRQCTLFTAILVLALFFALIAFPVFAGGQNLYEWWAEKKLEIAASSFNVPGNEASDILLSSAMSATPTQIQALSRLGYGYGESAIALLLARESGKSLEGVVSLRNQALGWGKVASLLGVDWHRIQGLMRDVHVLVASLQEEVPSPERARIRNQERDGALKKCLTCTPSQNLRGLRSDIDLPQEQVEELRESGLGYGEIAIAQELAEQSGKTVDEAIALFNQGHGWGEIASLLGVNFHGIGNMVSQSQRDNRYGK